MMGIGGHFGTDFHKVFHSFCEDPAMVAGDVT
jgi:hypothetical protein